MKIAELTKSWAGKWDEDLQRAVEVSPTRNEDVSAVVMCCMCVVCINRSVTWPGTVRASR